MFPDLIHLNKSASANSYLFHATCRQMIAGYCYGNPMTMLRYPNYSEDIKSLFKQWEKVKPGLKQLKHS